MLDIYISIATSLTCLRRNKHADTEGDSGNDVERSKRPAPAPSIGQIANVNIASGDIMKKAVLRGNPMKTVKSFYHRTGS